MKKNFLLLCGLLLSVCGFVACSDDNTETPAPEPTFPELVTETAEAGEVIELSFSANYDWTATISEATYTYFQLLDGETKVNTLSGAAGEQTIKVAVAEDVVFENAPVAEVTLTMNSISQVIAKITYPVTEREVAVYAPMLNQYSGAFQSAPYGTEGVLYSYNETAMTDENVVAMQWGVEKGNYDDADTFFVPVMIEANFAYTLAGPEWMLAVEAGVAGKTEYIIKADATKIPAESGVATIEVLAGEEPVASFDVAITGANDFAPQLAVSSEAAYAFDGEAINFGLNGQFVAGNYVKVVCDAEGATAEWLTVTESTEGDAVIKTYEVSATATANEGTENRIAYVFYFAANAAPAADAELFDAEGNVKEEYSESLASVVTQYTEPATIEGTEVDNMAATFSEVGADFANTWFFDDLGVNIGSKYELSYWGKWATSANEYTYFTASRPIASITCYAYNDMGSLVEVDNDWVRATTFGAEEEKVKFRVYCEDLNAIPEAAKDWQTGEGQATVLIEHTDGSYSAIYFHIAGETESEEGGVAFENEQYAGWANATLVELKAGDALYDQYFYEYSSDYAPAKFYHLTYEWPIEQTSYSMVKLTGIPSDVYPNPLCEWAYYDQENQIVVMEAAGAGAEAPGAIAFMNGMGVNTIVILCTLNNAE